MSISVSPSPPSSHVPTHEEKLKKFSRLFSKLLCKVKIKWSLFSNFCDLLKISELYKNSIIDGTIIVYFRRIRVGNKIGRVDNGLD